MVVLLSILVPETTGSADNILNTWPGLFVVPMFVVGVDDVALGLILLVPNGLNGSVLVAGVFVFGSVFEFVSEIYNQAKTATRAKKTMKTATIMVFLFIGV